MRRSRASRARLEVLKKARLLGKFPFKNVRATFSSAGTNEAMVNDELDKFGRITLKNDPVIKAACAQDIRSWTVDDVYNFIVDIGFAEEAENFKEEHIDGAALLLLKKHHLLNNMRLELVPALAIYRRIYTLQTNVNHTPVESNE